MSPTSPGARSPAGIAPSKAKGGKPPKPALTGIAGLVKDSAGFNSARKTKVTVLIQPHYVGGKGGKGGGGSKPGSFAAGLAGEDGGEPPNAPPYPAYLKGEELGVPGGRNTYVMELIQGTTQAQMNYNAMLGVTYTWERWDISHASKDPGRAALEAAAISLKRADREHESGAMEAAGRRWADFADDQAAAQQAAESRKEIEGQSLTSRIKDRFSNEIAAPLAGASWVVGAGGALIDTVSDARPQRRYEKEMPWPNKEGLYLVRAIARPDSYVDGKEEDGSDRVVRRAPSIATMVVEIQDPKKIGKEAVDKSDADLAQGEGEPCGRREVRRRREGHRGGARRGRAGEAPGRGLEPRPDHRGLRGEAEGALGVRKGRPDQDVAPQRGGRGALRPVRARVQARRGGQVEEEAGPAQGLLHQPDHRSDDPAAARPPRAARHRPRQRGPRQARRALPALRRLVEGVGGDPGGQAQDRRGRHQ